MSVRGEERSRKRYAVRDDASAFISEQPNRARLFDERRSKTSGRMSRVTTRDVA